MKTLKPRGENPNPSQGERPNPSQCETPKQFVWLGFPLGQIVHGISIANAQGNPKH